MRDRKIQHFQKLSLSSHDCQPSQQEQTRPSLPGIENLFATAEQQSHPSPVARNHPQSTTSARPQFLPPSQHSVDRHAYPTHNAHHQGWAYATVESSPADLYSSYRGGTGSEYAFENSSISSSSRESSVYPHGSMTPAGSQSGRVTRKKRGSDCPESGPEREAKRPSTRSQSDDGSVQEPTWCKKCKAHFDYCQKYNKHMQEAFKVTNEKFARRRQAIFFRSMEDDLEQSCEWKAEKSQWTGNQNSSGLTGDKQETIEAFYIRNATLETIAIRHGLENEANELFQNSMHAHRRDGATRILPACSLMAADTPSGERPCPGANSDNTCSLHGTNIECRKARRATERRRNVHRINPNAKVIQRKPAAPCPAQQSESRSATKSGSKSKSPARKRK